jgi:hypothetical protein
MVYITRVYYIALDHKENIRQGRALRLTPEAGFFNAASRLSLAAARPAAVISPSRPCMLATSFVDCILCDVFSRLYLM